MLSKMFKKPEADAIAPSTLGDTPEQALQQAAVQKEWEEKLQSALGDDAALQAIVREAPLIEVKISAVSALSGEEALKSAERELRTQSRRVHSVAKRRYEGAVAQREARARAAELIESASQLLKEPLIPANRLVDLDHAWQALDASLLEDAQKQEFASLREALTGLLRARGEGLISVNRFLVEARQAMERLHAACAVAGGGSTQWDVISAALAAAREAARAKLAAAPAQEDHAGIAELCSQLQAALAESDQIEARLEILAEVYPDTADKLAERTHAQTPEARWHALPALADVRIARALDAHFEAWQRGVADAHTALETQRRQQVREQHKSAQRAQLETLSAAVQAGEAALAEGQLAEAAKHLAAIEEALHAVSPAAALQTRIDALRAECARLRGWQHWGGGQARESLVTEAEALAARCVQPEGKPLKLPIKQHAEDVEGLRTRWKELDRLGGATSQTLWHRFDAALKAAYVPVAAHLAHLKAQRQENLEARKKLLAELDAVPLADASEGASSPSWREIARALEHFQGEWRKLGPVEHTVPHKARDGLLARMNASVARVQGPLQETRSGAQAEREKLIERARALSASARDRDIVNKVRELQAAWQQQAKALPLARNVENALWTSFKGATDAVFKERDAAFSARDAGLKANQTARETLIATLRALNAETPAADIKRTMASVDSDWRKAGEAPRSEAARLDAQFRAAREAAQKLLAGSAHRAWHAICDNALAKLALCQAAEAGGEPDLEARWSALPILPKAWETVLDKRFRAALVGAPVTSEALDSVLLQLESTLDIPSPPEFQSDRRELKFRALKNALESRQGPNSADTDPERLTAAALGQATANAVQRERLGAVMAAVRAREPLFHKESVRSHG
jgi:hypothetical protein